MKINRYYFLLLIFMILFGGASPTSGKQKADTGRLRNDLALVWPLAQTVKIEYDLVSAQLQFYKTEAEKESFLKEYELFVKEKYFKRVLELNLRQGKLLLLLINREVGKTPFELLKENIGLQRAVFWQRFAKIVGANLREKYDPKEYPFIEIEIQQLRNNQPEPYVFQSVF